MSDSDPYDAHLADSYLDHVSELWPDVPFVAQEDIYNQFGALLVAKGAPISPKTAVRLSGHRLQHPVDQLIGSERQLSSRSLAEAFQDFLSGQPDLAALVQVDDGDALLRHLCLRRELPLPAMQRLTVMKYRFPELMQRTLGVTVLAVLAARELGWNRRRQELVFEAALFRDVGLLHLGGGDGGTIPQYSRATLTHGAVSARILAMETDCGKALLELLSDHHERPDGFGFPRGKLGERVSPEARLLSALDAFWSVRTSCQPHSELADMQPYLRVNSVAVGGDALRALLVLSRRAGVESTVLSASRLSAMSEAVSRIGQQLNQIVEALEVLRTTLAEEELPALGDSIYEQIGQLLNMARASGLNSSEALDALSSKDAEEQYSPAELTELAVTQSEFIWCIRRIARLLPEVQQDLAESTLQGRLQELTLRLEQLLGAVDAA